MYVFICILYPCTGTVYDVREKRALYHICIHTYVYYNMCTNNNKHCLKSWSRPIPSAGNGLTVGSQTSQRGVQWKEEKLTKRAGSVVSIRTPRTVCRSLCVRAPTRARIPLPLSGKLRSTSFRVEITFVSEWAHEFFRAHFSVYARVLQFCFRRALGILAMEDQIVGSNRPRWTFSRIRVSSECV